MQGRAGLRLRAALRFSQDRYLMQFFREALLVLSFVSTKRQYFIVPNALVVNGGTVLVNIRRQ